MNTRKLFDKNWNTNPFRYSCVKYILSPTPSQVEILIEYANMHRKAVNAMSCVIYRGLKDETINASDLKNRSYADTLKKIHESLFLKFDLHKKRQQRGITFQSIRFYKGYKKRNKSLPKRPASLDSRKALYIQDGIYKDLSPNEVKGILQMGVHGVSMSKTKACREIEVSYMIPKRMSLKKPFLSKSFGGNLEFKKNSWCFTALATIPFEWSYIPEFALGFDINYRGVDFLTFSEEINIDGKLLQKIAQPDDVMRSIGKIRKLNNEIRDKGIKSSERRAIRRKLSKAHSKFEQVCFPYCEKIAEYAKEKKALLCIDDLSCGARIGTFGQDKIISCLTKICYKEAIPFVMVPTPWTSQTCSECKQRGTREDVGLFTCKTCGEKDAQINAAINIAFDGWNIWRFGKQTKKQKRLDKETLDVSGEYK